MEEDEYKQTYQQIASVVCVFEKTLTSNRAKCAFSKHFWLADREGYSCKSSECASICSEFLQNMREKSRFTLKLKTPGEALAHNMEIRVQAGSLQGLHHLFGGQPGIIPDIQQLVSGARQKYGSLQALPYAEIVKFVSSFQGRSRRKRDPS